MQVVMTRIPQQEITDVVDGLLESLKNGEFHVSALRKTLRHLNVKYAGSADRDQRISKEIRAAAEAYLTESGWNPCRKHPYDSFAYWKRLPE